MPTVLRRAGVTVPEGLTGEDLVSAWEDAGAEFVDHARFLAARQRLPNHPDGWFTFGTATSAGC